jgi:hypothetical protein
LRHLQDILSVALLIGITGGVGTSTSSIFRGTRGAPFDIFIHHQEDGQNMRMIGVLFTIGVLSGAMAIRAQVEQPALQGLPQYGVTLTGTPENPIIENHSGRVVIGYSVKLADANGRGMLLAAQVLATSIQPAGIPDGGAIYAQGNVPVNSTVQMTPKTLIAGQGPIVTAALRSVIFADGQFVGVDELGAFDQFGKKLKAITEVGMMARIQAWEQIEALAQAFMQRPQAPPPNGEDRILTNFRQLAAMRLAQTRKFKGEAAAGQLAEIYSSLPTLWK